MAKIKNSLGFKSKQFFFFFQKIWQVLLEEGPSQFQFWFIAMAIGVVAGFMALLFRKAIESLQARLYLLEKNQLIFSVTETLPWYWILLLPVFGGLLVGFILHRFTPDGRVRSVADVIEGAAIRNGKVETRAGIASAVASLITLSSGGSSGREGPVVHLAAVISTKISRWMNANGLTSRDLLGCAVAAAVSASFNAPIAGTIFALEVVLRHFALHAFAPISIAAVAGTVINRLEYGNVTEFELFETNELYFYVELPAFLVLGLISGLIAVALMKSIFFAEDTANEIQRRYHIPRWLRPAIAGLLLGIIAIFFPHIIGVGYDTTSLALTGQLLFHEAIIFCIFKGIATVVTISGRMGGGVFSPSLMVGALAGLGFGIVATSFFPNSSGSETLYALAGMGAVASAVLGAPISTTLIVFELTGDWQTGLAVMASVSIATIVASRAVHRSFFLTQLERRGLRLADGPQSYLLSMRFVNEIMRPIEDLDSQLIGDLEDLVSNSIVVKSNATLDSALAIFENMSTAILPVVVFRGDQAKPELHGALFQVDVLKAYNKALISTAAEEHS